MPEKNGIDSTLFIREKIDSFQQPKAIIGLTADVSIETKNKCMQVGMQDFITKPVQHKYLKEILEKHIS